MDWNESISLNCSFPFDIFPSKSCKDFGKSSKDVWIQTQSYAWKTKNMLNWVCAQNVNVSYDSVNKWNYINSLPNDKILDITKLKAFADNK